MESPSIDGGAATTSGAATEQAGTPQSTVDFSQLEASSIPSDVISQHPDFRNLQSTYDRRIAQLERQLQNNQGQAAQAVTQVQEQYGQTVRQALGDRLDDTAHRDLQLWEMENRIQAMEAERQQMLEQQARQEHLNQISQQYGVDSTALMDVSDPLGAYQLVADQQAQQLQRLQAQLTELQGQLTNQSNAEAHSPDTGGGQSVATSSAVQNDYNLAAAHGDQKAMDAIQRYAVANEVQLDTGAIFRNPELMKMLRTAS